MTPPEPDWQINARAHLLEARRKTTRRLGSKKSRDGCQTCKIRKIKCDETKPACHRCLGTGRKCDGYVLRESGFPILPETPPVNHTIALGDRRGFEYFVLRVAPRMGGLADREFWSGPVLQIARGEPVVLDALLALSTLYEHPQFMESFLDLSSGDQAGSDLASLIAKSVFR